MPSAIAKAPRRLHLGVQACGWQGVVVSGQCSHLEGRSCGQKLGHTQPWWCSGDNTAQSRTHTSVCSVTVHFCGEMWSRGWRSLQQHLARDRQRRCGRAARLPGPQTSAVALWDSFKLKAHPVFL